MSKITKTTYYPKFLDKDSADTAFKFIRDNVKWVDSIFSARKQKITRKGYVSNLIDSDVDFVDDFITQLMMATLKKIDKENKYTVVGVYVNYYRSGKEWAPSHSHKGMVQMVISLGATRTLVVGKKEYEMSNGDVIVFGSSNHEILLDETIKDGRISIATFMTKL